MKGMEFGRILAALLVAAAVAMLSGWIAGQLVRPASTERAVPSGSPAIPAADVSTPATAQPVLELIAMADVARGEKLARTCVACHSFTKGGPNGIGPNLWGSVGGPKEYAAGYAHSGELLKHGGPDWTYVELNKFLFKPNVYAPGTKMSFVGIRKAEDRAALLAWLRLQADKPVPLPGAAEIAAEKQAADRPMVQPQAEK